MRSRTSWSSSHGDSRNRINSRQLSARSKAGRRAERSCAAVGQAGQTTTAAPSTDATRKRRRRGRHPTPSEVAGDVVGKHGAAGGAGIMSPQDRTPIGRASGRLRFGVAARYNQPLGALPPLSRRHYGAISFP